MDSSDNDRPDPGAFAEGKESESASADFGGEPDQRGYVGDDVVGTMIIRFVLPPRCLDEVRLFSRRELV